jgi:hypothetical protein
MPFPARVSSSRCRPALGRLALAPANVCLYPLGVGLTWTALRVCHQHLGALDGQLTPWACGREGGLSIGPYQGATAAMAAADEYVAAHAEGADHRSD